jgi:predicted transcriptional regulator
LEVVILQDPDVALVFEYFRHLFPDFTLNHATIYKMLWKIAPTPVDDIMKETGYSIATVYKILNQLSKEGLIHKTAFKPIGYYAINPIKDYSNHIKKILSKLEKGANQIEQLLKNSSGQSGEKYLIKNDGGQQKLLLDENRKTIRDEQQLLAIKDVIEAQLKETEKKKLKEYAIYK